MKSILCKNYQIHINNWSAFRKSLEKVRPSSVFILVDENTEKFCLPYLFEHLTERAEVISIPSGEVYKNIETCQFVWSRLVKGGADRQSLVINLGGGVIGDLGGFCAATYMRGIRFIQVPTTLLSQVDASVGGKLGVDFMGYKNMVGLISDPAGVFIFTDFLRTLPADQFRSGYAELLKHGLIADRETWEDLSKKKNFNGLDTEEMIYQSLMIKKTVTEQDPNEKGLRKILNFGHTIGHAVESYWMQSRTPLLHGEAIAIGMVGEAYLSYRVGNISENELFDIRNSILSLYGHHPRFVKPSGKLIEIMKADKKNSNGHIKFGLLGSVGQGCYDVDIRQDAIEESFIFYTQKL